MTAWMKRYSFLPVPRVRRIGSFHSRQVISDQHMNTIPAEILDQRFKVMGEGSAA